MNNRNLNSVVSNIARCSDVGRLSGASRQIAQILRGGVNQRDMRNVSNIRHISVRAPGANDGCAHLVQRLPPGARTEM